MPVASNGDDAKCKMKCTLLEKRGKLGMEAGKPRDPESPEGFPGGLTRRPQGRPAGKKECPAGRILVSLSYQTTREPEGP